VYSIVPSEEPFKVTVTTCGSIREALHADLDGRLSGCRRVNIFQGDRLVY